MLTKNQFLLSIRDKSIYFLLPTLMGLASIAICSASTNAASSPTTPSTQNNVTPQLLAQSDFQTQVLELVNAERQKVGAPPLQLNDKLGQAAQRHAEDMAKNNFVSHDGSDGSTIQSRIEEAGYDYSAFAENVAGGQSTPEAVLKSWLNSSGHRRNILNPDYKEIGIGYAKDSSSDYTHYWTQVFGTSR